ncbi:MAG: hypothetical protein CVU71_08875 [Deltaproteobacteria bacterium HGW-Deltaproteobacteria-6]|jgi:hypothetical protein|nr:MAG: hypothetical protein CVU71_08875 [Deltaproteobacteria bacterium HGW-Deltaproteobacteria-6]
MNKWRIRCKKAPDSVRRRHPNGERKRINQIIQFIIIPIIVGLVGVSGTLGGVMIANRHYDRVARTQVAINMETFLFQQRLKVIERAANIFGKIPGIEDIWTEYLQNTKFEKNGVFKAPVPLAEKLADYQGEFDSVIYLASIYFGPKTRAAITALSNEKEPWWKKKKENRNAFMAALVEELALGINHIPKTLKEVE